MRRVPIAIGVLLTAWLAAPGSASADVQTYELRSAPITVGGYQAGQGVVASVPRPPTIGHITHMEADLVDAQGDPIPVSRLMLHHVVFLNRSRRDATCSSYLGFDNRTRAGPAERFFSLGEERNELELPPGYGYRLLPGDQWTVSYMLMNHRAATERAFIRYRVTVDNDPGVKQVIPLDLDVRNCRTDPIYNVPGTGGFGSTHATSRDFVVPEAGRIVGGLGHVHGGAKSLNLTQPSCGNRQLWRSVPRWGFGGHSFYRVRPILHEPGPVGMSRLESAQGIPVAAGERLRLNSLYDNSRPHVRVMGRMRLFLDPDPAVTSHCGALPGDLTVRPPASPGRAGPIPFTVPLTGFNRAGRAVPVKKPPGRLRRLKKKRRPIRVSDRAFSKRNVLVKRGRTLRWRFDGLDLHNVTLANGPIGIGSPNLDRRRTFSWKFRRRGTYRLFCSIHPVRMRERIVVRKRLKKAKRSVPR